MINDFSSLLVNTSSMNLQWTYSQYIFYLHTTYTMSTIQFILAEENNR